jgi:methylmalonyl-CoA mutase
MAIELSLDADQFLGLAKLRAVRRLIWRVADACGAGDAVSRVRFSVETSRRMMAKRDPWANMLRTTMACAAGAMGGADAITVLPFTQALGRPDAFARRIARNSHHVLMEESALGRVADPAGGSWYVEKLTSDLAEKSWALFQQIEAQGGMGAALSNGFVQDEIAKAADARAKLIATGRMELTGSSAFPKLGSDGVTVEPWPVALPAANLNGATARPMRERRLAEQFDALREASDRFAAETGAPPKVFLASLGPLSVHSGRTTWISNFLAAGGIESINGEGFTQSADAGRAFAESGATVACLCSSDDVYGEMGEAVASLLKTAGAARVYLAGRPKDKEAALQAAGVDEFIYVGCDAVDSLTRLQGVLNVR